MFDRNNMLCFGEREMFSVSRALSAWRKVRGAEADREVGVRG